MADPRRRIQDVGSKMADAKRKKIIGNVTKLIFAPQRWSRFKKLFSPFSFSSTHSYRRT